MPVNTDNSAPAAPAAWAGLRRPWPLVWGALLLAGLAAEAFALLDARAGDTLSEAVWWLLDRGWPGMLAATALGAVCGHWFMPAGPSLLGPLSSLSLPPLIAALTALGTRLHAPALAVFALSVALGALLWRRRMLA